MKIKSIRLYNIEVIQNNTLLFQDSVENAPQELLNCDIKSLELTSDYLSIQI